MLWKHSKIWKSIQRLPFLFMFLEWCYRGTSPLGTRKLKCWRVWVELRRRFYRLLSDAPFALHVRRRCCRFLGEHSEDWTANCNWTCRVSYAPFMLFIDWNDQELAKRMGSGGLVLVSVLVLVHRMLPAQFPVSRLLFLLTSKISPPKTKEIGIYIYTHTPL